MDGKMMLYSLRNLLQEGSTSAFMDDRTSYDVLWEAACQFAIATRMLTSSQTITTAASTGVYELNPDYLSLTLRNDFNEYVLKYYDGTNYYWPTFREYNMIYQNNALTGQSIPDNFSITDGSLPSPATITGTTTSAGALTNGYTVLTDSTAGFITNGLVAGDQVHNITDGSDGVIINVPSETAVWTALFGGTNNDWTSSDSYVIVPQIRKQLVVDPFSLTSGHTITVFYIQKPDPVYTDYQIYKIPSVYMTAVIKYAAWLYKYRDREPNFGDAWYKYWDAQMRKAKSNEDSRPDRNRFTINFRKRGSSRDRSNR